MIGGNELQKGLVGLLLQSMNVRGVELKPYLDNNEIVIEINEEQVKDVAFAGLPPQQRDIMQIKLYEGKMVIRIKVL